MFALHDIKLVILRPETKIGRAAAPERFSGTRGSQAYACFSVDGCLLPAGVGRGSVPAAGVAYNVRGGPRI